MGVALGAKPVSGHNGSGLVSGPTVFLLQPFAALRWEYSHVEWAVQAVRPLTPSAGHR